MNADLKTLLAEHIDAIVPPPGDLDGTRDAGRRIRRRRRTAVAAGAVATLAAVGGGGTAALVALEERTRPVEDRTQYAALGPLDFTRGARAYADPGGKVYLGGRAFDHAQVDYLDTDAVATEHGIVFFDRGRPMLLPPSGTVEPLVDGPVDHDPEFHPTAKADSQRPLVAWATLHDGEATLTVRDMTTGEDVATTDLRCGACTDLVIDGLDDGVVFVRTDAGTRTWDTDTGRWRDFIDADSDTVVADVRNGVVLYQGRTPPDHPGEWRLVPGAIDAQLTFDGRHVLYWDSTLEPTTRGGEPVVLEQGPAEMGDFFGWYAVDTDGSVLVATGRKYPDFTVYDCEVPSGACEEIGRLRPEGGDPLFIGVDM